jgi:hypothetical protein
VEPRTGEEKEVLLTHTKVRTQNSPEPKAPRYTLYVVPSLQQIAIIYKIVLLFFVIVIAKHCDVYDVISKNVNFI